jgi:hypothetical protein
MLDRSARKDKPVTISAAIPAPTFAQQISQQQALPKPQVAQAGLGGNKMMIVVGLILAGGFIYNTMKKKQGGTTLGLPSVQQPTVPNLAMA